MAASIKGANASAGSTVTIPPHAVGDLIIIWAYRDGSTTPPTKPTASGTVPAWIDISTGTGTSTNSGRTAYFVATATNHTSGTWTNATGMVAVVIQGQASTPIGGAARGGGTASNSATAPAITQQQTTGKALILHFYGHRTVTAWDSAPSGYTRQASVATEVCFNTKNSSTSDGSIAQSCTTSSSSGYYGATVEVLSPETSPSVTLSSPSDGATVTDTTPDLTFTGTDNEGDDIRYNVQLYRTLVTDDFNRPDENPIGGNWTNDALGEGANNQLQIVSNQLKAVTAATSCEAYWNANTFSGYIEQYFTIVTKPGNSQRVEMGFIQQPGTSTWSGYRISFEDNSGTDTIAIRRADNAVETLLASVNYEFSNGDQVAVSKDTNGVFRVFVNGNLVLTSSADTTYTTGLYAYIGIRDTTGVIDNWGVRQIITDAVSGTDAGFSGSPDNTDPFTSGQPVTYTVQSELTPGTTYYWRVRGIDPSGSNKYGAWSSVMSFTINISPSVSLNSPQDGAIISDTTPDLTFTGTDAEGDDIRYEIQIAVANDIASPLTQNPPANGDGDVWNGSSNWATVRGFSTGNANQTATADSCRSRLVGTTYYIDRFFLPFDTSAIPDNATITSAVLSVYVDSTSGGARDWCLVNTTQADPTSLASGDYSKMGSTEGATRQTVSSTGWLDFTLNATGLSWINKQGYTLLGLRDNKDLDNVAPTDDTVKMLRTANYSDPTYRPKLVITYDVPSKISGTDAGFSGSPDNTDPFTSGQAVTYTVQSPLSAGNYYWRVRGKDPSGSNTWGSWSSTRSFTISSVTTQTKTIQSKARVKSADVTKTVSSKARIKFAGITKTVSTKARIKSTGVTKTISAKANIVRRRYWVGGTGNWSDTNHWSTSSGGSGGASVPTSSDDVFIDSNSGFGSGGTITINVSANCYNFTSISGHNYTITGSGVFNVYGSFTLESGSTFNTNSNAAKIYFKANTSVNITTYGRQLREVWFVGSGTFNTLDNLNANDLIQENGSVILGGNFSITNTFYQSNGTFDANDYDVIANNFYFYASSANTPTIIMGSGTWEATGSGNVFYFDEYDNQKVNITPETSTIKISGSGNNAVFYVNDAVYNSPKASHTFNNIWISGTWASGFKFYGSNTFNEFKVTGTPNQILFQKGSETTVNTFNVSGTAGNLINLNSIDGVYKFNLYKSSGTVVCDYLNIKNSNTVPLQNYNIQSITYNWTTLTGGATSVTLSDEGKSGQISLPFIFNFFGEDKNLVWICSNGAIKFNNSGSADYDPFPIPRDDINYKDTIFGYNTDLNPEAGGTIKYETVGTSPNRIFVVEFNGVPTYSENATVSFQIKLFENDNHIEIHTQSAQPESGGKALQGIENSYGNVAFTPTGRNAVSDLTLSLDAVSFSYGTLPSATWYAGTNSIDSGNNSGWIFIREKNVQAKARIKSGGVTKNISAKARIRKLSVTKTIQSKARVKLTQLKTISSKARILSSGITKSVSAKARIKKLNIEKFISSKARVLQNVTKTISAKAYIQPAVETFTKTISAKSRIKTTGLTKNISSKARIKHIDTTKTVSSKARIALVKEKSISAKSRILSSGITKTISAKADVKKTQGKDIQAKARIKLSITEKTISSRARVKLIQTKTVSSKARVKSLGKTKSILAKARIKIVGVTKSISARASVSNTRIKTISARAFIKRRRIFITHT
jgi:hypothetical protein